MSLLNEGRLEVPSDIAITFAHGERGQYFFQNTNGNWYSKYGIVNSLIYIPPLLFEKWCTGKLDYRSGSRVLYLNIYNLVLSLLTAFYLYRLTSFYTASPALRILHVLAAFYATFWWFYLRAQNFEIFQTLFLLAAFYHLAGALHAPQLKPRQLAFAGLFFSLLILAKLFYVILLPAFVLGIVLRFRSDRAGLVGALGWFSAPLAAAVVVMLAINAHKFGSPFETGYNQWGQRGEPIFSGRFLDGFLGFLFNVQYSIFLYFPIFTFALYGYSTFLRKFPRDGLLIVVMGATLLLVESNMIEWRGTAGYGPRYLLAVLPLVSLPFLTTLERLDAPPHGWRTSVVALAMALFLLFSVRLQCHVNALPFFTFSHMQSFFSQSHNPDVDAYFRTHDYGTVNADIQTYKATGEWEVIDLLKPTLNPPLEAKIHAFIIQMTPSNYYFWPDASAPAPTPPTASP